MILCASWRAGITQWYRAGLRAGWFGVRVSTGVENFSLHHRVQTGSGAHKDSHPMGTRGSFLRWKWQAREAEHSHPSSAEVKNAWRYTSTPQYNFTKAQWQLYFLCALWRFKHLFFHGFSCVCTTGRIAFRYVLSMSTHHYCSTLISRAE
jgi:hypothetical protein